MRAIITGAAGQDGLILGQLLSENDNKVTGIVISESQKDFISHMGIPRLAFSKMICLYSSFFIKKLSYIGSPIGRAGPMYRSSLRDSG